MVMEYLEGESLSSLLRRQGALLPERIAELMLPVLSAVECAHRAGIVHRDLKPANIFLARTALGTSQPKVLDFGIAKVTLLEGEVSQTASHAYLGTPTYMSPEQTRSAREVDARSDQFSLGVILYLCVTGRLPFRGKSVMDVACAILQGQFNPPRMVKPDLDESFEQIILRAMQLDPDDRFASVHQMGRALLAFASEPVRTQWTAAFEADRVSELPRITRPSLPTTPMRPRRDPDSGPDSGPDVVPDPGAPTDPVSIPLAERGTLGDAARELPTEQRQQHSSHIRRLGIAFVVMGMVMVTAGGSIVVFRKRPGTESMDSPPQGISVSHTDVTPRTAATVALSPDPTVASTSAGPQAQHTSVQPLQMQMQSDAGRPMLQQHPHTSKNRSHSRPARAGSESSDFRLQ
jgi:serine/threonine protein kinase